ncbi:SusD/RagB family nutrient-binding outer membrane lipoprotein [Christiangramia fulva]|nr:SusD/RagB family nutrient-binding outer membrane lipoprotein [Christiangramia fulva]
MKNNIKILLLLLLTLNYSCSDSLQEVNVDPNTFPSAGDAQVLSSAIGFLGYVVDTDLNYSESFLWSQYYTWGQGVSIGNSERYVAQPDDFNGYWARAYANCLADLNAITKNSSAPAYSGIAKVLKAYLFQGLVDHFGDIPFSEALAGAIEDGSILAPSFDAAGSAVYPGLVTLLDEALSDLERAEDGVVGEEDFIYQGDISKWIKFANSLKLRVLMRTSETDPQAAAIKELIANGTFIETVADMPYIPYTGASGDQNPMFARAEYGVGMFYFASNATLDVLESLDDPRGEVLYTKATTGSFAGQLHGIDQGTIKNEPFTAPPTDYSMASEYAYSETNPVILMSPWEVWFLRAEAAARYDTSDDEEMAFETAIALNFKYMGIEDEASSYINSLNYSSSDALVDRIDQIAVQKWISLNGTQEDEGWIEARRFDRPESRLFTNGIWQTPPLSVLPNGTFPSAWLYPESERSLNPNAPAQRTITDNIFWDN